MVQPDEILGSAHAIVVIDWPTKDVPVTLARAGYHVIVKGGPGPEDYSTYEQLDGEVVVRPTGRAPDHADLVYVHRPLTELAAIAAWSKEIGAKTIWVQSGQSGPGVADPTGCWMPGKESQESGRIVESAGLGYIDRVYIAEAVRRLKGLS